MSLRIGKATVFIDGDDWPWLVAETPSEVAAAIEQATGPFVQLTLGNTSDWNGKPVYLRAAEITAIGPPRSTEDEDE